MSTTESTTLLGIKCIKKTETMETYVFESGEVITIEEKDDMKVSEFYHCNVYDIDFSKYSKEQDLWEILEDNCTIYEREFDKLDATLEILNDSKNEHISADLWIRWDDTEDNILWHGTGEHHSRDLSCDQCGNITRVNPTKKVECTTCGKELSATDEVKVALEEPTARKDTRALIQENFSTGINGLEYYIKLHIVNFEDSTVKASTTLEVREPESPYSVAMRQGVPSSFEHDEYGEGGTITVDHKEVTDFDGAYDLPKGVRSVLIKLGYEINF